MDASGARAGAARPAPDVVVFDVGEVLVDETRVWATWADLVGVSPLTFAAVLGAAIAQGEDWPAAFWHVAPNIDVASLMEVHEQRYGGFGEQDLYPDARPCLQALVDQGRRVAIAGNQPAHRRAQLLALDLPAEVVLTSDDLGAEKPSPAFFDRLLEALGVGPDVVLYVGDRVDNDVEPAQRHGLATCWLQRGPWGQLQDLSDDLEEPDLVLEGLGELPALLEAWEAETTTATDDATD